MRTIAGQLGGTYYDNPVWWAKRVITVHPLGGAPMGRHPGEGLCDEYGEVFGHPGLYVMDGALLPGPVGANPSLTIAAVADRACTHLLEIAGRGRRASAVASPVSRSDVSVVETVLGLLNQRTDPGRRRRETPWRRASGLLFTEQMKGFVALGVDDPQTGHEQGRANKDRLMFELTISVDDVDRFVAEPGHLGSATATSMPTCSAAGSTSSGAGSTCSCRTTTPTSGRCSTACGCAARAATR